MEWWVDKRKDGWKAPTTDEWIDDSEGRGLGGYVRISIFISRTLRSANQQGVVGGLQVFCNICSEIVDFKPSLFVGLINIHCSGCTRASSYYGLVQVASLWNQVWIN
mgnify:CR=1 FL=1